MTVSTEAVSKMLDQCAAELLSALSDDEIRRLQTELRGTTTKQWRAIRGTLSPDIVSFIASSPAQRAAKERESSGELDTAILKLAGWQMCSELSAVLEALSGPHPIWRDRAAAGVESLLVLREGTGAAFAPPFLWPFDVGSPFRDP